MRTWEKYSKEQQNEYIQFLKVYGALSNLFRQKQGDMIPYLDSKFQETVFARVFNCENVDIGNTPHDVLSIIGDNRIGIGLKTWMGNKPSYQKVMQLKRYSGKINKYNKDAYDLAYVISEIKNERMKSDYKRLGLSEDKNIYHYITRNKGSFIINECTYPLIDLSNLKNFNITNTAFTWSDGIKEYKYTFSDSQVWQYFGDKDKITQFDINIIEDPFDFLLKAYIKFFDELKPIKQDIIEVYLPLYSYKTKEVGKKSGLNAWNATSKTKGSSSLRPLHEIYIPVPSIFYEKHPCFFIENRFHLQLPNGKKIPALITQDNMKALQSGSNTEKDENGKYYGQSALGKWLLVDVLGLKERVLVTRKWLQEKGTDSVRIWRKKEDYNVFYIDFAPFGSFEAFMNDEPIPTGDE